MADSGDGDFYHQLVLEVVEKIKPTGKKR